MVIQIFFTVILILLAFLFLSEGGDWLYRKLFPKTRHDKLKEKQAKLEAVRRELRELEAMSGSAEKIAKLKKKEKEMEQIVDKVLS